MSISFINNLELDVIFSFISLVFSSSSGSFPMLDKGIIDLINLLIRTRGLSFTNRQVTSLTQVLRRHTNQFFPGVHFTVWFVRSDERIYAALLYCHVQREPYRVREQWS